MRWCNCFGVGKNPNKFGDNIVLDLSITADGGEPLDNDSEVVARIELDKEGVENLIRTLQKYISD
jgi:hypothetical protein